jgi:hypothetical protein
MDAQYEDYVVASQEAAEADAVKIQVNEGETELKAQYRMSETLV